jgi:hypothetical protein
MWRGRANPPRKHVTLEDILGFARAKKVWAELIGIGVPSKNLGEPLLQLATGNLPIYPPRLSPKQLRRLPERLRTDAGQISKLLQLEPLPEDLTSAGARHPALLKGFADAIERLKFVLPKRRHKPETWVEIAIVNQIVWATAYDEATETLVLEKVDHHFEDAAELITAAYAAGGVRRVVDAVNLKRSWYRYSHIAEAVRPKQRDSTDQSSYQSEPESGDRSSRFDGDGAKSEVDGSSYFDASWELRNSPRCEPGLDPHDRDDVFNQASSNQSWSKGTPAFVGSRVMSLEGQYERCIAEASDRTGRFVGGFVGRILPPFLEQGLLGPVIKVVNRANPELLSGILGPMLAQIGGRVEKLIRCTPERPTGPGYWRDTGEIRGRW